MRTEIFQLPSGAKVELRAMTVADEDLVTSGKSNRQSKMIGALLDACCLRVVDPGPYGSLAEGDKPDWNKVLGGDRFAAFIYLRTISFRDGTLYDFETQCPACGKRGEYRVNLLEELPVQELSEESAAVFERGGTFNIEIGGKTVSYRHALGSDEDRFEKLQEQYPDRVSSCALRTRIKKIEGLSESEFLNWLSELTSDEAEDLRDAMDENDCGMDTEIEITCRCGFTSVLDVPFDASLFLPGRGRRKRKRARRLQR